MLQYFILICELKCILTHPRDESWVTIAAPIPFVPPVTRAFREFRRQKLAGGGGGTDKSLVLDAWTTERTIASPCRKKKRKERMFLDTRLHSLFYFLLSAWIVVAVCFYLWPVACLCA